ncbi:MAG: 4Fe-4S cluster-binding domain-containing protein [Bacilli bacterium]|nr:4Fe-4S cluster-binding domain-containing protein [Bacilli bacterium]
MKKQILIYELTSLCNSRCEDCLRTGMNQNDYSLTYKEVLTSFNEVLLFSKNFPSFELKLSGGEPTIWKDRNENKDIIDIIKFCHESKINYSLISNGKIFGIQKLCDSFFNKLKENKIDKLTIYVTIDNYHKNYNNNLDNVILDNLLSHKEFELNLYVQSTLTKKSEDNLAFTFIEKYSKLGVKFIMNPLLPWGKGKNLDAVVPYLNLNTSDKSMLGDYEKYFYILGKSQDVWDTYNEYLNFNNFEAIKSINCCGKTITFMENKYYYCMPCSGKDSFEFAKLGNLDYKKYLGYVENNKFIQRMKNNDFDLIELPIKCPVGYGICGLCRKMIENE